MKSFYLFFVLLLLTTSCKKKTPVGETQKEEITVSEKSADFTLVFASCSDQDREQPLWEPILEMKPDLFIWGGDNIYADTDDMAKMKADYDKALADPGYARLAASTKITGTWDDHDFGKNDAGMEWDKKWEAQQLALDFLGASEDDPRRTREGLYASEVHETDAGSIKFILLDTRYFRSSLKQSEIEGRRYDSWTTEEGGDMLGDAQWTWLEEELKDDAHDFTVIVSSVQFLNDGHGWEKWGNMPSEMTRMYDALTNAKARNIFFLSGDRHMAEVSVNADAGLGYPLVDFTSGGLTHTWIDGATEGNEYRVSNVVKRLNYGLILFDFESMEVTFQIRGEDNFLYEEFQQKY